MKRFAQPQPRVPQTTEPGTPRHSGEGWRGLLRHRTPESRDQQLPGLQREATSGLGAMQCSQRLRQPLLLSQEPCQANCRPAIRRGVCWPLFCSSLAEVRSAVRTRKPRPPVSTAHYSCSVRQEQVLLPASTQDDQLQLDEKEHSRHSGQKVKCCSNTPSVKRAR